MVTNESAINFLEQVESMFGQLSSNCSNSYPDFIHNSLQEITVLIQQLKEFFKEHAHDAKCPQQPEPPVEELRTEKFDRSLLQSKRENVSDSSSFTIVNDHEVSVN